MTTDTPSRTDAQRHDALRRANEIRSKRAQLKKDIKAGRKRALIVLLDPPDWTMTMKLYVLLLAQPKFGRVKVNRTINAARVSPSKTLGGLSERQRGEIAELLESDKPLAPVPALSGPFQLREQDKELAAA